jgi:ABC-2 type transport system ATP-binding protein
MESVVVENLIKKYKKAHKNAVDDISFSVKEGNFFAFLGPNGAGKTTTISILSTTLSKTSGKVTIAGYDLDKNSSKVRQNIGVIFQNPSLDKNLTAEENVRFHSILYGLYPFAPAYSLMPESYKKKINNLSQLLGIEKEIFKPIKTFSGGMKRKLEIIRSIMHNPKVLFLDEPTEGLDPISRRNLWEYLNEVRKKEKITVFLTTHYLEEAEDADTICIINHGKIQMMGTPEFIKGKIKQDYLLLDSKNKDSLEKELKHHKFSYMKNGVFKVSLKNHTTQQIIKKIDTPLTLLKIHSPTLEEAYLEIIGGKTNESA